MADEPDVDARLRDAAPDLLNACKLALEIPPYAAEAACGGQTARAAWREVEGALEIIRAAIAKAEGT